MQIFKAVFGVLLLLFCLTGCKTYKEPQPITQKETEIVTKTITKTQRDTIIQIKADSSYYEAYIDCRDGKPKILDHSFGKPQKVRPGKNLKPPTAKIDENGKLQVSCESLEQQLTVALWENHILESKLKEKTIIPPPVEIEKKLTWRQKLYIRTGQLSILILLIYLGFKIPWKRLMKLF